MVDSRQAKLSHFEGRALAEFGKYQLGGKPVCFASHRFGETSAQETEKRIVAYISEDRLTAILFALGKLARFTTFFGPWSLQELVARARARTPRRISPCTATIRPWRWPTVPPARWPCVILPVGTATLAAAYAQVHGIENHEACDGAGHPRSRLAIGNELPLPAGAPVALHRIATWRWRRS